MGGQRGCRVGREKTAATLDPRQLWLINGELWALSGLYIPDLLLDVGHSGKG